MKILVEAYLARNFGDDLFVVLLAQHYSDCEIYLMDDQGRSAAIICSNHLRNLYSITTQEIAYGIHVFDAYILVGGDFYPPCADYEGRCDRVRMIKRNGGKTFVLGGSLYKNYSDDALPQVQRFFNMVDVISFRDRTSYEQCKVLFPDALAYCTCDMAFLLRDQFSERVAEEGNISNLGISVRRKWGGTEEQYAIYCKEMAEVAELHLKRSEMHQVTFLAFSTNEYDGRDTIDDIMVAIDESLRGRVQIIEYARDVMLFIERVGTCDAILCTRFHSLCLALILRKPFAVINYEAKIENLLSDLEFNGLMVSYGEAAMAEVILDSLAINRINKEKLDIYESKGKSFFGISDMLLGKNETKLKCNDTEIKELIEGQLRVIDTQNKQIKDRIAEIDMQTKRIKDLEMMMNAQTEQIEEQLIVIGTQTKRIEEAQCHVAQLRDTCLSLSQTKSFKVIHLLSRVNHQFFKGNASESKAFIKWLCTRFGGRHPDTNHQYNPIFQIIDQLNTLDSEVLRGTSGSLNQITHEELYREIDGIVSAYQGKTVMVLPELVDWNIPLFQRPQQLAMAFAQQGILFVFVTPNGLDNCRGITRIQENCYLIEKQYIPDTIRRAAEHGKEVVLDICSTDNLHFLPWIKQWADFGCKILYEYIDEISDDITGKVPAATRERHEVLLKDKSVYIVATADKLYDEVIKKRGSNARCLNSGNGVDCQHFRQPEDFTKVPEEAAQIIRKGKPIIGYFGAIANWFDFELIMEAANKRPQYEFMLIGPHYGNHNLKILKEMKKLSNVHLVGAINYHTLPFVAHYFTVATIPFVINEITESTSPIKLFEYMAMGKPVVTTPMRECFKYSVVRIGRTTEEYVLCLDEAVKETKDPECAKRMMKIADENSWLIKAQEITKLLEMDGEDDRVY